MEAKTEKSSVGATKKKITFSASSALGDDYDEDADDGNESATRRPKSFNRNMRNLQPLPAIRSPSATHNQQDSVAVVSKLGHTSTSVVPKLGHASAMPPGGGSHASCSSDRMSEMDDKPRTGGGMSSQRTVIIIAAFLVVGFIFVTAGILVLWREHHFAFKIAGGSFLAVGLLSFVWCIFLQQKNFKRLVHELEKDIYFGHIVENHVIRRLLSYDG